MFQLGEFLTNCQVVTMDVTSLFTNIPNNDGLTATMELLTLYQPATDVRPSNFNLVKMLEMVVFNLDHYLQIGGIDMGT